MVRLFCLRLHGVTLSQELVNAAHALRREGDGLSLLEEQEEETEVKTGSWAAGGSCGKATRGRRHMCPTNVSVQHKIITRGPLTTHDD